MTSDIYHDNHLVSNSIVAILVDGGGYSCLGPHISVEPQT